MTKTSCFLAPSAHSWPESWDLPHPVSDDTSVLRLIHRSRERCCCMKAVLVNLHRSGRRRAGYNMSRRYLFSYSAQLDAVARAYNRHVGSFADADPDDLRNLAIAAVRLSPWAGSDEKAMAYQKPKPKDGFRWLHRHGLFQYALELLAADAAEAGAGVIETQFIKKGGIPKAQKWFQERLGSTSLVVTVDIPRCFDAIFRSSLVDNLHLPRWVVQRVLFDPMDKATYLYPGLVGQKAGPCPIAGVSSPVRGIPQGSALSQLASESVIALVLKAVREVAPGVHVASQGDNLVFLLEDESCKVPVLSALTSSVAAHFGKDVLGELTRRITCVAPRDGFWFCRRFYQWKKGALDIKLPEDWIIAFELKTLARVQKAMANKAPGELESVERSIKGWMRQSPKTDAVLDAGAELLAHVKYLSK